MGYRTTAVTPTLLLLLLLLICSTLFSALPSFAGKNHPRETAEVEPDDQQAVSPSTTNNNNQPPRTIIDTAKSLFSPLSTTRFAVLQAAASNSSTWIKLKTLMLFKQSPDSPTSAPTLERQANDPEEASADAGAGAGAGAGADKVKEAVLKSLDQGTVAMENSARSAAKLAGDAIDTTAKKLRKKVGKQSEAEL